jgi:hypothetical protein
MEGPTLSLPQAAQRLRLSPGVTREKLLKGELRGFQAPNGRWRVFLEDVERMERDQAVERAVAAGQPTDLASRIGIGLYETLQRMHTAGKGMAALQMQYDSHLESLLADAAEAETRGDTEKAAELRTIAEDMSKATYGFDRATGQFVLGMRQEDGSVLRAVGKQPA